MALRSVLRPGWQTRQRPNASAARPPVVGLRSVSEWGVGEEWWDADAATGVFTLGLDKAMGS